MRVMITLRINAVMVRYPVTIRLRQGLRLGLLLRLASSCYG